MTSRTDPASRWRDFSARHDAPCPDCGYSLRGLETARCPECGHWLDTAGLMYCSEPLEASSLLRTWRWFWVVLLINIILLLVAQAKLPPIHAWPAGAAPPAGWYGLLTLRFLWFTLMLVSISCWRIQLAQDEPHMRLSVEFLDRILRSAHFAAILGTLVHAAWVTIRLLAV